MIRALCLATVLGSGIGLAGSPGECAAQSGSQQQGMSLGSAIGEALRSPFHAAPAAVGPEAARLSRPENDPAAASSPDQLVPRMAHTDPWVAGFTFASAGLSHMAATYLFWDCALDEGFDSSAAKCALASIVPLVAVPAPSVLTGAGLGRAMGASAAGLGGGAAAYLAAMLVSEGIDNANPVFASLASSAVHAAIVNRLLR